MSNVCPHCQTTPCIGFWRKLTLGPSAHARCRTCGLKVGVDPVKAWLVMLPVVILTVSVSIGFITDPIFAVGALIVLFPICGLLYLEWVPLLPDEISNHRLVAAAVERIAAEKAAKKR